MKTLNFHQAVTHVYSGFFYQFQLSYEHISKTEYWGDLDIYIGPVLSIMV